MTGEARFREEFTPFSLWVNDRGGYENSVSDELCPAKYGFSYVDVDGMNFAVRPQDALVYFIEVKGRGAILSQTSSQRAALSLNDATYRAQNGKINTFRWRGRIVTRRLRYLGTHILRMSGACPGTSRKMWWDAKPIDNETLIKVLRFENSPIRPQQPLGEDYITCIHDLKPADCYLCSRDALPARRSA